MSQSTPTPTQSFIPVAPDSHFPIQNLPYGVFRPRSGGTPHIGVAIGDQILDLALLEEDGLLDTPAIHGRGVFQEPALNAFMSLGRTAWRKVRDRLRQLLSADEPELRDNAGLRDRALLPLQDVEMLLPVGHRRLHRLLLLARARHQRRHHAARPRQRPACPTGCICRSPITAGPAPLSSAAPTCTGRSARPKPTTRRAPSFGPSRCAGFRAGDGLLHRPRQRPGPAHPHRGGRGPHLRHGAGQRLERPRHPEVGIRAAWPVPGQELWHLDLALGRHAGRPGAVSLPGAEAGPRSRCRICAPPAIGPYDIHLEVWLQAEKMPEPQRICTSNSKHLYWNVCQQLAHHTVNGCNLRPGDLLASGTISGPDAGLLRQPDGAGLEGDQTAVPCQRRDARVSARRRSGHDDSLVSGPRLPHRFRRSDRESPRSTEPAILNSIQGILRSVTAICTRSRVAVTLRT